MNPLHQLRDYFIGEALSKTDDVFEKARLRLTYNISVFLFLISVLFGVTLLAEPKTWQMISFAVATLTQVALFVILRRTGDVQKAGYAFLTLQLYLTVVNSFIVKFRMNADGTAWMSMGLIYTYFVLGRRWGFFLFAVYLFLLSLPYIDRIFSSQLLDYYIDPSLVPPDEQISLIFPLLIIIYSLAEITRTRRSAEEMISQQKNQLESSNVSLEQHKRDVTASITYARRIQNAVLPHHETIARGIPLSFILYRPKDIVSGDFYWFHELDADNYILVCADCTGHGVPGAMMTVVGSNLLNQTIIDNKIIDPSNILTELDQLINQTLKQHKEHEHYVQDGMDLALVKVDKRNKKLTFTSAKRPGWFVSNGELRELKGSKHSLGGMISGQKHFENISIDFKEDDMIYLFTDGYIDQFGGPKGKKFSTRQFRELIPNLTKNSVQEQFKRLEQTFEDWKKGYEQIDDVLVIGIKF